MKRFGRLCLYVFFSLGALAYACGHSSVRAAEGPGMHCEADCYACVRCTVFNAGDLVPRWTATVKDGVTFKAQALSTAIPVDKRWTRIDMYLPIKGEWVPICSAVVRRPAATGGIQHQGKQ